MLDRDERSDRQSRSQRAKQAEGTASYASGYTAGACAPPKKDEACAGWNPGQASTDGQAGSETKRKSTPSLPEQQHRALLALLTARRLSREALDRAAAASNSPDLVMRLRALGLDIGLEFERGRNRYGKPVRFAIYELPTSEDAKARKLLGQPQGGDHGN